MPEPIDNLLNFLRNERENILKCWLEARVKHAREQGIQLHSAKAWLDHMPLVVDRLLHHLNPEERSPSSKPAQAHAIDRFEQSFDLAEMILDLGLMEEIVLKHVGKSAEEDSRRVDTLIDG